MICSTPVWRCIISDYLYLSNLLKRNPRLKFFTNYSNIVLFIVGCVFCGYCNSFDRRHAELARHWTHLIVMSACFCTQPRSNPLSHSLLRDNPCTECPITFPCYKTKASVDRKASTTKLQTRTVHNLSREVQCVPLATEPGISLIILPLMRILQRNLKRTYRVV